MFEIYFDPNGAMYDQNGIEISFMAFLEILKKNGVKIEESTEKRKYSILKHGELNYIEEEGNCEVLKIHI